MTAKQHSITNRFNITPASFKTTGTIVWLLIAGFTLAACQNNSTPSSSNNQTKPMTPPSAATPAQYADTMPRLLTIANLQQNDSSKTATVWFFETPQIFEVNLADEKGVANYNLLTTAQAKQEPVNVTALYTSGKNIIAVVAVATPAQLEAYKAQRAQQQPARPAPKPGQ